MDMLRKHLLNSAVTFDPPDRPGRGRVVDALQDEEPYEPDAAGDDAADIEQGEDEIEDGEPEDEELEPEQEPEDQPRRRSGRPASREERRIEALNADKRRLEAEVAATNSRLAALEARLSQPQQRVESQEEEAARLALMSPEERITYRTERSVNTIRAETQRMFGSVQDQADATAFRSLITDKPQYKRFVSDVEKEVTKLRASGVQTPREAVLMFLVGKDALARTEQPRQKARSQQRMREQEVRPESGRSDVRGNRRQSGSASEARERRLANVQL